jgi:hypothetical protein
MNRYEGCACRNCQTGRGACLKIPAGDPYWVVRKPNGQEIGPFATHAEASACARRVHGGTPVKREA